MANRLVLGTIVGALFLFGLGPGAPARAAPQPEEKEKPMPEEIEKAQKKVEEELAALNAPGGDVKPITGDALARTFPGHLFFSALYRQYPVSRPPPAPLKP